MKKNEFIWPFSQYYKLMISHKRNARDSTMSKKTGKSKYSNTQTDESLKHKVITGVFWIL